MATPAQIAANRRNARLSTGPQTARGKFFSSRNRLRHGLRSHHLILPDEDPAAFANLLRTLRDLHLATIIWKLERVNRAELQATRLAPEASLHQLSLLSAYRTRLERDFAKSLTSNPQFGFERQFPSRPRLTLWSRAH